MVKGEWGITARQLGLVLRGDFRGMFTLAIKCRLEPVLSRFATHLHCEHGIVRQAQTGLQSLLDERGACMSCTFGRGAWTKWTETRSGRAASPARDHFILGSFTGQQGCL